MNYIITQEQLDKLKTLSTKHTYTQDFLTALSVLEEIGNNPIPDKKQDEVSG